MSDSSTAMRPSRGKVWLPLTAGEPLGRPLAEWCYRTPRFPRGIEGGDLMDVPPEIQRDTTIVWFLANHVPAAGIAGCENGNRCNAADGLIFCPAVYRGSRDNRTRRARSVDSATNRRTQAHTALAGAPHCRQDGQLAPATASHATCRASMFVSAAEQCAGDVPAAVHDTQYCHGIGALVVPVDDEIWQHDSDAYPRPQPRARAPIPGKSARILKRRAKRLSYFVAVRPPALAVKSRRIYAWSPEAKPETMTCVIR
jgi:hypothetical protein